MIRFVEVSDAESLLPCYANPTESVITNSFNGTMGYFVTTKVSPSAIERIESLRKFGFKQFEQI